MAAYAKPYRPASEENNAGKTERAVDLDRRADGQRDAGADECN